MVFHRSTQGSGKFESPKDTHFQWRSNMAMLCLLISALKCERGVLSWCINATLASVLCFFAAFWCCWLHCLKQPEHNAEVLPTIPKSKKSGMCLREKSNKQWWRDCESGHYYYVWGWKGTRKRWCDQNPEAGAVCQNHGRGNGSLEEEVQLSGRSTCALNTIPSGMSDAFVTCLVNVNVTTISSK
jgi:hypothetical protein